MGWPKFQWFPYAYIFVCIATKLKCCFVYSTVVLGQDEVIGKSPVKRSYVCPPNFVRLSHKCYFFSSYMATFQDAYWKCRDLHSNLAIIKNANQDKLIKQTLYRDSLGKLVIISTQFETVCVVQTFSVWLKD